MVSRHLDKRNESAYAIGHFLSSVSRILLLSNKISLDLYLMIDCIVWNLQSTRTHCTSVRQNAKTKPCFLRKFRFKRCRPWRDFSEVVQDLRETLIHFFSFPSQAKRSSLMRFYTLSLAPSHHYWIVRLCKSFSLFPLGFSSYSHCTHIERKLRFSPLCAIHHFRDDVVCVYLPFPSFFLATCASCFLSSFSTHIYIYE